MAREGFVVYHELKKWLEPYGDAERGRLFTAMLEYSITGEVPGLSGAERFIWPAIQDKIDKDREAYEATCKKNRENITKRYDRTPDLQPNTTVYEELPDLPTETQTETETETKQKSPSGSKARARGEYGWVKLTDEQYEKLQADLGQEELQRCIRYIDESAQSTSNKNKWKDWNLVIRKCSRDGWGKDAYQKPKQVTTASDYKPPQPPTSVQDIWNLVDKI